VSREQPAHDSYCGLEDTDDDVSVERDGPNDFLYCYVEAGEGGRE